ncbi:hypothetical protein J4Q44_G00386210 [Coregonus suidteri]|uniref:Uncharacterized protein n=1 Tax=Coregonus suidteri TaxID=861788 RepID=A0AAN8K9R3_9TELE
MRPLISGFEVQRGEERGKREGEAHDHKTLHGSEEHQSERWEGERGREMKERKRMRERKKERKKETDRWRVKDRQTENV